MNKNHESELNEYINSGDPVNFMLTNGMTLAGVVKWQDEKFVNVVGTVNGVKRSCTISKGSLLCYFEHSEEDERYATIENV
ncbi:hypothetical protein KGY79_13870 [Candidatus Bipolaricaulota bacterium]|nr:hypothetical protein [Candidatus Bipolaricaulota bacterium]